MIKSTDTLKPEAAIVIYESIGQTNVSVYCELHQIDEQGNLLSGKAMTEDFATSFGNQLVTTNMKLSGGMIPPGMLHLGWQNMKPIITWYTPDQVVPVLFEKKLAIPNGKMHVPALLWQYNESSNQLNLFALKSTKGLLNATEKLYKAPFHNIDANGTVCLGASAWNHIRSTKDFAGVMSLAMEAFWKSKFSHMTDEKPVVGNLNNLLKSLVGTKKRFPLAKLVDRKQTVKNLLASGVSSYESFELEQDDDFDTDDDM